MSRLYQELPKGTFSEHGVLFGRDQNGQPGEQHFYEPKVAVRGATQKFARRNPLYQPEQVEGLGERFQSQLYTPGRSHTKGPTRTWPDMVVPGFRQEGLGDGYPLAQESVQNTFMRARDFPPTTRSSLPLAAQHYTAGIVRPQGDELGMRVLSERVAGIRGRLGEQARLRREVKPQESIDVQVNGLGELEPRMNTWGRQLHDTQKQWTSPPGPRTLLASQEVVATQAGDIQGLRGLGGLGDGFTVYPTQQAALAQGFGYLFTDASGAVKITGPYGALTVFDVSTIYPDAASALKKGYGYVYAQGGQYYVSGPAGAVRIASPYVTGAGQVTPPPPPVPTVPSTAPGLPQTPIATTPPPAVSTVVAPGGALPTVVAPGLPIQAPAPFGAGSGYGASGGGGGGASSFVDATAPALPGADQAPATPSFLMRPINLPIVGPVPTWQAIVGAIVVYVVGKRILKGRPTA